MFKKDDTYYMEEDDQCYRCYHRSTCPLTQGLAAGVLLVSDDFQLVIDQCKFFQPRFKVVDNGKKQTTDSEL